MILHTVMSPHIIFNEQGSNSNSYREIEYKGIKVEVNMIDYETCVINRIITTDVMQYLNPELQPGNTITLKSAAKLKKI